MKDLIMKHKQPIGEELESLLGRIETVKKTCREGIHKTLFHKACLRGMLEVIEYVESEIKEIIKNHD